MTLKQYLKLKTILPILLGIIVGSFLFFIGEVDDSPVLCLIGIILGVCLIYIGILNTNKINDMIKPQIVLPLFFGIFGLITAIILFFDGEFGESLGLFIVGIIFTLALITIGIIGTMNIIKNRKIQEYNQ